MDKTQQKKIGTGKTKIAAPKQKSKKENEKQTNSIEKYQPSGAGGTRSPPETPHRLHNSKWPPVVPKMANGVWFLGILSNFR